MAVDLRRRNLVLASATAAALAPLGMSRSALAQSARLDSVPTVDSLTIRVITDSAPGAEAGSEATVKLVAGGNRLVVTGEGNGPVNALDHALRRAIEQLYPEVVRFELIDYRDLAAREPGGFDRIVSVGMFEHVGAANFETFFRACANMLTADGVMLLHTIGRFGKPGATDAFTRKYIFPGGYIPALSETIAASEKSRLIATDIETLRLHYAATLRHWYANTLSHEAEIVKMMGARFFRMWCFYLAGATDAFESGGMGNYQIQFARSRHALPLTREYMAEAEGRYAG